MKNKLKNEYMKELVSERYTASQYMILLILWQDKPQTAVQMARTIGVHKQAMTKLLQELKEDGHIEVDRIEGRNKFYRACPNRQPKEDSQDEGQLTFPEE